MATTDATRCPDDLDALVVDATAGDEAAFSVLADCYRRELLVHSRRMLGSVEDSEDAVQETFLRAWRSRASYRGDSTVRAWLYRIATNVCLNALERRRRRPQRAEPAQVGASENDADRLIEEIVASEAEPDEAVAAKETVELAFMAAIRHLPSQQRAVLILRGAVGLSAKDAASLLDVSVASVNSALQRARRSLQDHLPEQRLEWARGSDATEEERALLALYLEAIEHADGDAFVEMLHLDGRNASVGGGVRRALGRAPRDFADCARDVAATGAWRR
ncbi:MAG: RNA polymerase subunit sigma-70 [Solirubrobacterales bacterium]